MKNKFNTLVKNRKLFGSYLAGLPANGHIITPKIDGRGKLPNTPALHITFKESNRPLVELLISHLGSWIRPARASSSAFHQQGGRFEELHAPNGRLSPVTKGFSVEQPVAPCQS